MSEVQHKLEMEIANLQVEVSRTFHAIDWRLDPKAHSARKELLGVRRAIRVDPDSPPRIL